MDKYVEQIRKMILDYFKNENVMIVFFGSREENKADEGSDVDIGIKGKAKIDPIIISKIKTLFEESNIPYHVDIVDLTNADQTFVENILKNGTIWKNFN